MNKQTDLQNYKFKSDSFEFANKQGKIFDQKLSTKAVSFAQDSFRRFCKNKSSVAGAIVLGILILLALFVPWFSPHSVDGVSAAEAFLRPKLFPAGTGFWDGTKKYTKKTNIDGSISGILYDFKNETPAGFLASATRDLKVDSEPTLVDIASPYGSGGYVMFENQNAANGDNVTLISDGLKIKTADSYSVTIKFLNKEGVFDGRKQGEYRIYLLCGNETYVLKDWSTDYSQCTLSLTQPLLDAGVETINAKLVFELKPNPENTEKDKDKYSYLLLESVVFGCSDSSVDLSKKGFEDATKMVLLAKDDQGNFPEGYWSCTGRKGVYAAKVYYCTFVYDTYEAAYGKKEIDYSATEFNKLVAVGLCSYDESIGPSSFKVLSDACPIVEVVSQKINSRTGKLLEVKTVAYKYYSLGYTKMPKFVLGTDASGLDLFTKMFTGLRTSLILGVCTAAFCFLFGLVWGAISGYFGGIVDLSMERFCEILSGVPWIVVMTLCILHLGNNFFTFFLALCMTGWMGTAARTRTQFYRFKNGEYVLASRTLGSSDIRLIFRHILPNALGTIVTASVLMIVSTIYSESTLAYLNLGLQGIQAFGVMLAENQQYIQSNSYLIVCPSVVMALMMISFNLFGNGLRDAINPVLRGAED